MNILIHITLTIFFSKFQQRFYLNQIRKESKLTVKVNKACACTYIPYINKRKMSKDHIKT